MNPPRDVTPGIQALENRRGRVQAYVVDQPAGLTLIDTLSEFDAKAIRACVAKTGKPVKHIVLTHAHDSHIGGIKALKDEFQATVYAHRWESDIIAGQRRMQQVSLSPRRPYRVYHLQFFLALGVRFRKRPVCGVDEVIDEGDSIGALRVLHTPGHTPGSIALHWPERGALFTGDTVVTWPILEAGWRGFTLNRHHTQQSLQRLAGLPDVDHLCVGHGPPTRDGSQKLQALAKNYQP